MFAAHQALLDREVSEALRESMARQEVREVREVWERLELQAIQVQQVLQEHPGWLCNMSIKVLGLQRI